MRASSKCSSKDLGFSPAEALRAATEVNAGFMAGGDRSACSSRAGPPISSRSTARRWPISACCRTRSRLRAVHIAGKEIRIPERDYDPRQVTDFALVNWTELYTRKRVAELPGRRPHLAAAE